MGIGFFLVRGFLKGEAGCKGGIFCIGRAIGMTLAGGTACIDIK